MGLHIDRPTAAACRPRADAMTPDVQRAWDCAARFLPAAGLAALREACLRDDARLIRGATTAPAADALAWHLPCQGADPLAYALWHGHGLTTVAQVDESWSELCFLVSEGLGHPAGIAPLLDYLDEAPRGEVLAWLAAACAAEAARRAGQ